MAKYEFSPYYMIKHYGKNEIIYVRDDQKGKFDHFIFEDNRFEPITDYSLLHRAGEAFLGDEQLYMFSEDVINIISRCIERIKKAHAGQKDKAGEDYYKHPIEVARLVDGGYSCIMAALLHDIVEDTDTKIEDLHYDDEIVLAVDVLTHRENESREEYLRLVRENDVATAVKIADLKHNSMIERIPNPTKEDYERCERYLNEIKYLESMII